MKDKKEFDWFDRPSSRRFLWRLLLALCLISAVAGLFGEQKHHFAAEEFPMFYSILGFAACTVSILVAKGLGIFLKKDTDYYDDDPE